MINNLLIIFLAVSSHTCATSEDKIVTDSNNSKQFDINKVECIGKIRIDHLFRHGVRTRCKSCILKGTDLQDLILEYTLDISNIKTTWDPKFQKLMELIHNRAISQEDFIDVDAIGDYLSCI